MLPSIVTILHAKIKNEIPSKIVADATNKNMINFICRYAFLTRAYNQNSTHPAVAEYLPEVKAEYLNMCKGTYQVIPVAVFIMTLYNACFMFQTDKTDNMLIKALEWFDMTPNVDDNTFFKTMSKYESKYSLYDYFANKYASTNHITAEQQTIYPIQTIRLCVMASFKRKLCLRKQKSKTNQQTFIHRLRQPAVFSMKLFSIG
jgi:hypothetical protein